MEIPPGPEKNSFNSSFHFCRYIFDLKNILLKEII